MRGASPPPPSQETLALQAQAKADRIEAIRDSVTDDTRNLLIRFGRRAFTGSSLGSGLTSGLSNFGKSL